MSRLARLIILIAIVLVIVYLLSRRDQGSDNAQNQLTSSGSNQATETASDTSQVDPKPSNGKFLAPVSDFASRVTKKSYGTYVEPGNSPVSPEKFTGYHNAVDFEIISGEENVDVPIKAICDGKLAVKRMATGYGGVVAQHCVLNDSPVLVVYGHVRVSSVPKNLNNEEIKAGEFLGMLGEPGPDTDNERKHLHLGIHKGTALNIAGYVQTQNELTGWIDPLTVLK